MATPLSRRFWAQHNPLRCIAITAAGVRCCFSGERGRYPHLCGTHMQKRDPQLVSLFTPRSPSYGMFFSPPASHRWCRKLQRYIDSITDGGVAP